MKPILNTASERLINSIVKDLPQSLLVFGQNGVGLLTVARYIADLCKINPTIILPEKDDAIDIKNGIIGIDIIRKIYDDVRTKTIHKRMLIIDYAETMSKQAQNAFLKLLEEPSDNVYFVLVSHSIEQFLPTIISRAEKIEIKPITRKQTEDLLDNLKINDTTKRSQLIFMADGLPAEIIRLNADNQLFNQRSIIIKDARELLRGTNYQKLLIAQSYKDKRTDALKLLSDMAKILQISIYDNPNLDMIKKVDQVLEAIHSIESNGNIRLCLARMLL